MRQSETEATAERVLARFSNTRPRAQSPERQIDIARIADSYCAGLSRFSGRMVRFARVEFHSYAEWDSVWDSVQDSVRASAWASVRASVQASVRASVRASVWASVQASVRDSAFESEIEMLEAGGVLAGVGDDGTCHVIIPTEDELNQIALEKVVSRSAKESAGG